MRLLPLLVLLVACGPSRFALKDDEIYARELWLPKGAEKGMFITWRHHDARGGPRRMVEVTLACVAERTIEWRRSFADGRTVVTTARFDPAGQLLAAWRGPAGETGRRLTVITTDEQEREQSAMDQAVERRARRVGISMRDSDARHKPGEEAIETPAGRFECRTDRVRVALAPTGSTLKFWWSKDPLPLDRMVRAVWTEPGNRTSQELIAHGPAGARPTLKIPE